MIVLCVMCGIVIVFCAMLFVKLIDLEEQINILTEVVLQDNDAKFGKLIELIERWLKK